MTNKYSKLPLPTPTDVIDKEITYSTRKHNWTVRTRTYLDNVIAGIRHTTFFQILVELVKVFTLQNANLFWLFLWQNYIDFCCVSSFCFVYQRNAAKPTSNFSLQILFCRLQSILKITHSLTITVFFGVRRAAVVTHTFLTIKWKLDRELLTPLVIRNTIPLCMSQYERAYSSTRYYRVSFNII